MTAARAPAPGRRLRGALATALVAALLAVVLSPAVPFAAGYDPAVVSLSQGYPEADPSAASFFRLQLEENLTACAWMGCTSDNLTQSDQVAVTVDGPDRLAGTTVGTYYINVSGDTNYTEPYTTIAAVLQTDSSNVVMNVDDTAELSSNVAYTKLLEGSSTMRVTLIGPNASANMSLYVFGYVGNGNHSTHDQEQVYNLGVKTIQSRPTRTVPLNVTVSNTQNVTLTGVPVQFFVKGPSDSDYLLAGNATVATIVPNGNATVKVDWDATWAEDAVYTVKVVIDPEHQIPETSEDNNVRFYQVNLGGVVETEGPTVGGLFGYGVLGTFVVVLVGLWWYNRRYE